jgi:putative ABC transport system permease protein
MQTLLQDLRYGFRMLVKRPGFTVAIVLMLALGIAINTVIFSVVNSILLRPLPFKNPERLVTVFSKNEVQADVSHLDFADWQQQNTVFEHIAAYATKDINLTGGTEPVRVNYTVVTADFFSVLGVDPLLGRAFTHEEDLPARGNVIVLSYAFWQRYFNGDRNVIGRTLLLNGETSTVVGVMPRQVRFPDSTVDLWKPIGLDPAQSGDRDGRWLQVIAHLKPGITRQQAESQMQAITSRLSEQYPDTNKGWTAGIISLQEQLTGDVRSALLLMWGAVAFVLVIACVNVANLLLARSAAREREIAIRIALGAKRSRIIRQLLTESILLSTCGGVAGLLLALWGIELIPVFGADTLPNIGEIAVDGWVLGYSIALSLLTGILSGLFPAFKVSSFELNRAMNEGGRDSARMQHRRARGLLLVSEVALTLILLVGAGLLIRSFIRLLNVDPGFNPQKLLTFRIAPPQTLPAPNQALGAYFTQFLNERDRTAGLYQQLISRIQALPGVQSAGAINRPPMNGNWWQLGITTEVQPTPDAGKRLTAYGRVITPRYFQTMDIPLVAGRPFVEADDNHTQPVAIINRTMAQRYWPNQDPIGKRLRWADNPVETRWVTIVSVVGDVRYKDMASDPGPTVYVPFPQAVFGYFGDWGMTVAVRTKSDPAILVNAIRSQVGLLDKTLPVFNIETMDQAINGALSQRRFSMLLLGTFAVLALILAAIGIYGVVAYSVTQRTHEIGIRMALGAQTRDILKLVVGHGMLFVILGIAIGLSASLALTRLMSSLLYHLSPTDPLTFTGISTLLTLISLLACYIPARRATKVDPMVALRQD